VPPFHWLINSQLASEERIACMKNKAKKRSKAQKQSKETKQVKHHRTLSINNLANSSTKGRQKMHKR